MTRSDPDPPVDEARARELLRRERERIERSLADHRRVRSSEVEAVDTDSDLVDEGEGIEGEEVDDALIVALHSELEAIERAEVRLANGTYGRSIESGEPIPAGRLEAIPWAERTAGEQERYERSHGGDF